MSLNELRFSVWHFFIWPFGFWRLGMRLQTGYSLGMRQLQFPTSGPSAVHLQSSQLAAQVASASTQATKTGAGVQRNIETCDRKIAGGAPRLHNPVCECIWQRYEHNQQPNSLWFIPNTTTAIISFAHGTKPLLPCRDLNHLRWRGIFKGRGGDVIIGYSTHLMNILGIYVAYSPCKLWSILLRNIKHDPIF